MSSSKTDSRDHLLILFIKEPIEGSVKPTMALNTSTKEANTRYQSLVLTLLNQLKGLSNTDIRFIVRPADAVDAVKFWILNELDGSLKSTSEHSFDFSPADKSPCYSISFIQDTGKEIQEIGKDASKDGYITVSMQGMNSPECGARWIHMAQLLAQSKKSKTIGYTASGSIYLTCQPEEYCQELSLPVLPKIKSNSDWQSILQAPIGGKINKLYSKLTGL